MAFIAWKSAYEIGINEIDEQHKVLLGFINKLEEFKTSENKDEILRDVLFNGVEHTKAHFASEESFMEVIDYPKLAQHKLQHEIFIKEAVGILQKLNMNINAVENLHNLLKDWFVNHIMEHDRQIGDFYQKLSAGIKKNIKTNKK
jgi:hemerythrin